MNESDFTPHERFLLFTGLIATMVIQLQHFSPSQRQEMNKLSAESWENHGTSFEQSKSAEVLMDLARRLAK